MDLKVWIIVQTSLCLFWGDNLAQHRCSVNTWWNELNTGNKQTSRVFTKKKWFALIDPKRGGCPFLSSCSLSPTLALTVTAVAHLHTQVSRASGLECNRSSYSRWNKCWNCISFWNSWVWIESMVELGMRGLERASILNNILFQICFLPGYHFNTEKIQGFELARWNRRQRMRSNFQLIRELTDKWTCFVAASEGCSAGLWTATASVHLVTFGKVAWHIGPENKFMVFYVSCSGFSGRSKAILLLPYSADLVGWGTQLSLLSAFGVKVLFDKKIL